MESTMVAEYKEHHVEIFLCETLSKDVCSEVSYEYVIDRDPTMRLRLVYGDKDIKLSKVDRLKILKDDALRKVLGSIDVLEGIRDVLKRTGIVRRVV